MAKEELNGYTLSRKWFDFCFENPEKITPTHTAMYFFIIEHCNRLGWKEKFGLPMEMTKDAIGIKNYRTFSKVFNDLLEWKFIILVQKSKNQYSSNVIAIANNTKATTKALDRAMQKHGQKQVHDTVCIDKQLTKEQLNLITNEIYLSYPTKCPVKGSNSGKSIKDKDKIKTLLKEHTKEDLINKINRYISECKRDSIYIKNFSTFLNNLPDYTDDYKEDQPQKYISKLV